jgi:uncharacterized protein
VRVIALEEHFRSEAFRRRQAEGFGPPDRAALAVEVEQLYDVGAGRVADLDAAGIDVQVLSHTPPGPEAMEPNEGVRFARELNDELASIVRATPDRYAGFAMLPTSAPESAAIELQRTVTELGFVGAMLHGTTSGRFLDDPFFWPIFEEAERLRVPIYLHPAPPPAPVRDAYYSGFPADLAFALATSGWGWHIETGLHVLRLALAGLFDKHPQLQIVVGHMGEALPFMLARADGILSRFAKRDRPLREYLRGNVHYTTSGFFSPEPLRCFLDVIGADRLMFAVDYPFSPNPAGRAFLESAALSQDDREKVAHRNAETLLEL